MSARGDITIRPMTHGDLRAVARIHRASFKGSRSTTLGTVFLRRMYRWFVDADEGIAVVAAAGDEVVGFAAGPSRGGYGRKLFRFAFPQVIWGIATHPWVLARGRTWYLWRSYLKSLRPRRGRSETPPPAGPRKANVASIAVTPAGRGRGVGRFLLEEFEKEALRRGCGMITLAVEPENEAARKLYESCGWRLFQQTEASADYEKPIDGGIRGS